MTSKSTLRKRIRLLKWSKPNFIPFKIILLYTKLRLILTEFLHQFSADEFSYFRCEAYTFSSCGISDMKRERMIFNESIFYKKLHNFKRSLDS